MISDCGGPRIQVWKLWSGTTSWLGTWSDLWVRTGWHPCWWSSGSLPWSKDSKKYRKQYSSARTWTEGLTTSSSVRSCSHSPNANVIQGNEKNHILKNLTQWKDTCEIVISKTDLLVIDCSRWQMHRSSTNSINGNRKVTDWNCGYLWKDTWCNCNFEDPSVL